MSEICKAGMAWTGRITETQEIPGADAIQRAEVDCGEGGSWAGVVKRGMQVGQEVVVFMPDAIVPNLPATAFMEKHRWRVRMMRLRGCPSEVLIVPVDEIPTVVDCNLGIDVTNHLGVKKYEKDVPAQIGGDIYGNFPGFLRRTDEPNFQKVSDMRQMLVGVPCYIATKYDGTSQTFYHRDGEFGACSRNWRLKEQPGITVWELMNRYRLKEKLPDAGNVALQWECVGPGIQGNPLGLKTPDLRLFDAFNIDTQEYLGHAELALLARHFEIPLAEYQYVDGIAWTADELRSMAAGHYSESGKKREGIVIRPTEPLVNGRGERVSFKVINLDYKGA